MGFQQTVSHLHPTHQEAMFLWNTHLDNVEPLCRINHIPTMREMMQSVSQQPELASKAEECMVFSIYYFAVFYTSIPYLSLDTSEIQWLKELRQKTSCCIRWYDIPCQEQS